jgi:hypothetical protein
MPDDCDDDEEQVSDYDYYMQTRKMEWGRKVIQDNSACGADDLCNNKVDALTKTNSSVCCMCHYGTHSSCCTKVLHDTRAYVCYKCVDEFNLERIGGMPLLSHHKVMDKSMSALSKLHPTTFVTPESYNAAVEDLHGEEAAAGDEGDEYEDEDEGDEGDEYEDEHEGDEDDEYEDEDEDEDEYEDEDESGRYQLSRVVL